MDHESQLQLLYVRLNQFINDMRSRLQGKELSQKDWKEFVGQLDRLTRIVEEQFPRFEREFQQINENLKKAQTGAWFGFGTVAAGLLFAPFTAGASLVITVAGGTLGGHQAHSTHAHYRELEAVKQLEAQHSEVYTALESLAASQDVEEWLTRVALLMSLLDDLIE